MKNNIKKFFKKTLKKIIKFFLKDTVTDVAIQEKSSYLIKNNSALEWQEGDRVDITLKYLNTTDPTSIDWTGNNKVVDNISKYVSVQLGYSVIMFTYEDYLPAGSVTITYNSILGGNLGKPTIPSGSDFAEKLWNPITGVLVLQNIYALRPGSSGFINLLYDVKARDLVSNETGILSDDNITARVDITVDGEVVYTNTVRPLDFKIELVKDEFRITKTVEQSIDTVSNDPNINNPNNFYWLDYTIDTSNATHTRELEKGQIIDILPKDAILVSITDYNTRDVLYNSYSTPQKLVDYVNYVSDPTGNTGGTITYSFDKNTPKVDTTNNSLFKFIIKVKFPLNVQEKVKVNKSEIQGYFEGEEENYQTISTAQISFTLVTPGFGVWDGNIYSVAKLTTASEDPHIINAKSLQYADYKLTAFDDYTYYVTKTKTTQQVDLVLIDDLMSYFNNNGFIKMEETEYRFGSVGLYIPIPDVSTDYELYVRYAGTRANDFVLYTTGTLTTAELFRINFPDNASPIVAFKVIYKGVTGILTNRRLVVSRIVIKQTDEYVREGSSRFVDSNSKFINYALLDVFRNGESILRLSNADYRAIMLKNGFTEEEIGPLTNFDIETYGHYAIRTKANISLKLECYRPTITKTSSITAYDYDERLYYSQWDVIIEARWSDLVQNVTFVDILPEWFSFRSLQKISLDSIYPIEYDVTVDENYKNSGRQRVMMKITSPENTPNQIIRRFQFRITAFLDDITKIDSEVPNYCALVSKDIPYPATNIQVGNNSSPAYRDDGTYFNSINPFWVNIWNDADSDRGTNDYVWYSSSRVAIPQRPIAGRSGIEKYVKTDLNPYYSRVGSKANLGSKFEYELAVNNPQANIKDIIVYDTLPFIGDRFHETRGGQVVARGSEWSPTFETITVIAPDGNNYPVYCTTSTEPGDLGVDSSWMEISEFFASRKNS